jgi:energy-coupling factor transporter ATP-binding protein EcfA2
MQDDVSDQNDQMQDIQEEEETFDDMIHQLLAFDPNQAKTLNLTQLNDLTLFIHSLWCHPEYDLIKLHERNICFFGGRGDVLTRLRTFLKMSAAINDKLCEVKKDDLDADAEMIANVLLKNTQITANVMWGYDSIVNSYRQLYCNQVDLQSVLPSIKIDVFFSPLAEEEMKNHQKLIRYYLEECNRRNYRRSDTALFEPKFTEDGHFTRTYTFACEVSYFIYDAIYPYHEHVWLFSALTEKSNVARQCIDYLEKCRDDNLPVLVKDRTKFSFRNGLYDARQNKFYPYGVEPVDWDDNAVCCNYIDCDFHHELIDEILKDSDDPLDIPTDNVQKILDSQEFPREVCRWFYASMGRMIFEIGDLDNWQYFAFCKGTAGSGKSTLLRLAAKFYSDTDVGNLMSEGQNSFTVEHIYDKFIFFCYDVDDKMNFSLTRWNQMVSGESIAVERKFKIPIQAEWKTCGAFAGNSYPPWVDQSGNVSRRMLIFIFSKMVRTVDTMLFEKCKLELGDFMKKCVSCYFQLREQFNDKGIWDEGVLPEYFHITQRQMQAETNPLQAFLQSDQCAIEEGATVAFNDFRAAYLVYCDSNRLPKKTLTKDFCTPLFDPQDIFLVEPPLRSNPSEYHGYCVKYILGVSLLDV